MHDTFSFSLKNVLMQRLQPDAVDTAGLLLLVLPVPGDVDDDEALMKFEANK